MRRTTSGQNVSAAEPAKQRRQGAYVLVTGRNRAHRRWSATEDLMLSGRTERFGTGALVEDCGSLQRTRREGAVETVSSQVEPPADDPQVARVLVNRVRLERMRQFGACWLGWELWRRLRLDRFFEECLDEQAADVPWSRVAAVLAINRLCAPGSELAIEERWYPSTALDDLLEIEEGKINDTRLYRGLDR